MSKVRKKVKNIFFARALMKNEQNRRNVPTCLKHYIAVLHMKMNKLCTKVKNMHDDICTVWIPLLVIIEQD